MSRIRSLLVGLVAMSLLVLAAPVAADTTNDVFVGESSADGVSISVMGTPALDLAATAAAATEGEAAASAVAAALGGEAIGERLASSEGATVSDPGDPDEVCEISLPDEFAAVLALDLLCAEAEATGDVPAAWGDASVGDVDVLPLGPEALAEIIDVLRDLDLDGVLQEVTGPVADGLDEYVGDVFDQLHAGCEEALGALELDDSVLDPILGELDPITDELPEDLDALTALLRDLDEVIDLPSHCEALLGLLDSGDNGLPVVGDIGSLLDALEGQGGAFLDVQLMGSSSDVERDGEIVSAWAGAEPLGVELNLGLTGLADSIDAVLADAVGPVLDALEDAVEVLPTEDAPVLGDIVADVLGGSGVLSTLLTDDLLHVSIAPGEAGVDLDLSTGEFDGDASASIIQFGGALATVTDVVDEAVRTVDSELLAQLRDSPLVDLVSIQLGEQSVAEDEVGGLPGLVATSGVSGVTVLGAVEGGVDVTLGAATAGVGHDTEDAPVTPAGPDPEPTDDPEPADEPLPVTGGAGLLLGLLALGGVTALRRRG